MVNEDEELKKLEEDVKKLESIDTGYGSPEPERKDNLFKFFREILKIRDTTRVGNLTTSELGITRAGVRPYLEIASYAEAEGLDLVADYFRDKSDIITSSSMSKKGFWPQLFVTQIKAEKKVKEPTKKKKSWFAKKETEEESE